MEAQGKSEKLTDAEYAQLKVSAEKQGASDGKSMGGWAFDGNTSDAHYARVLQGIEDGDPEILDMLPHLDLSGQWADGPTEEDVLGSFVPEDIELELEERDELIEAYRDAFDMAAADEVERAAREHVSARSEGGA